MEKLQQFELKHRADLSTVRTEMQHFATNVTNQSMKMSSSTDAIQQLKSHMSTKIQLSESGILQQLDDLSRKVAKLESNAGEMSYIDDSSKSLFINTVKDGSIGPFGVDTRKSAMSRKSGLASRNLKSNTTTIDDDSVNAPDAKMMLQFKNEIRQKLSELEEKFVSKDQVAEAVDKLGEEIAFDINQLESSIAEAKNAATG